MRTKTHKPFKGKLNPIPKKFGEKAGYRPIEKYSKFSVESFQRFKDLIYKY